MSQRHPMALTAAAATLLAATPLVTVFATFSWLFFVCIGIAVVAGVAMLIRTMRGPLWLQVLGMSAGLLLYLTFAFPSGGEILWVIPTGATFEHFNSLLVEAGARIRDDSVPIQDHDGILLLTTMGVGLVAMLVDLAAVGLRKPALAGLPMLAIYSVPVAVLPGGLSVVPFSLAAIGFLWLLVADSVDRVRRFGRRFTGEGRDVDLWESSPLSSAGRRLGALGVVIAILVPLAVPGMTSGLIDRFGTGFGPGGSGSGRGGSGPGVNLNAFLRDNLVRGEEFVMLRVQTDDPSPYYLRFGVSDEVTEDGFMNVAPSSGVPLNRGLPETPVPDASRVATHQYSAEVEVVDLELQLTPVYQQVTAVQGLQGPWFYDSLTNQIFSPRSSINGQRYQFDFVRPTYTAEALRSAGVVPPTDSELRKLTVVPEVAQVSELVSQLTAGRQTQFDRVQAIFEYFDTGFRYSLTTEPGSTGNAIVDFLFETKQGFCTQYAAAMAWLVREAGYPARVAIGFTRGRGATEGVYELTNHNLHAWTEVYFSGFGWVPFDATPSSAIPGSAPTSWAVDVPDPVNPGGPQEPLPGQGANPQPGGPDPRLPEGDLGAGGGGAAPAQRNWYLAAAAAGLLVLLILATPALSRRALRRRRRARSGEVIVLGGESPGEVPISDLVVEPSAIATARRDAHEAWAELIDTMIDYAVPVDESETPRATATRLAGLAGLDPAARPPVHLIARAEERARYAKYPLRAPNLDEALRVFREALADRATRWERLRAEIFPPSVLLRWRLAVARAYGALVGIGGRIRTATAMINPRRLLARGAR